MARMLKFGGPALPEGTHTWYRTVPDKDGRVRHRDVHPGAVVNGEEIDNPEYYVATGRASWVAEKQKGE